MYISNKDIEELNEDRLKAFLDKQYRENKFLDYKLKYEKDSKDKTSEAFLADVTAFANSHGGNIIIGVQELKEDGKGLSLPGELVGLEDGVRVAQAYRNLCNDSIDPPIAGITIKEIKLANGKWAVVVCAPISLRRPHMVTKGKNSFYIRRDDQTHAMTADEVKRTVLEVVSIEKNLDSYIDMVERDLIADYLQSDFSFIIHAAPYLLEEDQIDTSKAEIKQILQDKSLVQELINTDLQPAPNLHGIFGVGTRGNSSVMIFIHRTGYIGLAQNIKEFNNYRDEKRKIIVGGWTGEHISTFLKLCKHVVEKANIGTPYQIRPIFINSVDAVYLREWPHKEIHISSDKRPWRRERLSLPGIRLDSFNETDSVAAIFSERLKNAFGLY